MKIVLLPTDLTVESLYPVHAICKDAAGEKCRIHLIHTLAMPTGITDLLFLSESKLYEKLDLRFREAIEMLRKKYDGEVETLSFEFLWSNNRRFLRNYVQSRDIQTVYMLKDHVYKGGMAGSINCIPAIIACQLPIEYVYPTYRAAHAPLTTLLYRGERKITV